MTECDACGAPADAQATWCRLAFEQMLVWDFTDPQAGAVHHLTVLCYHLQHPHLYSQAGLEHGKRLLHQFVIEDISPSQMRQKIGDSVQSDARAFKITASDDDKGAYSVPIVWAYTAYDAMGDDIEGYPERVRMWAKSVYDTLVTAGEISIDSD